MAFPPRPRGAFNPRFKKEQQQVRKPFSPENMADAVGELAGKRY